MTLTPHSYPAYKPSGVPWLDDVPEHWEVRRHEDAVCKISTKLYCAEVKIKLNLMSLSSRTWKSVLMGTGLLASQPTTIRFGNAPSRARRIVRTGDTKSAVLPI